MIYTSYHAVAKENHIGISTSRARYSKVFKYYSQLTPASIIGSDWRNLSDEEYIIRFKKGLENLNAEKVFNELKNLAGGGDVVIVCFEKYDKMCHRHIVADWISEKLGLEIKELNAPKNYVLNKNTYLYEKKQEESLFWDL